jgi:MarR family 2-MHQ and catechol resistance regulon transcriptional repressor
MVIDNLEKRGLVKRTRDENDRRHYSVGITPKGAGLIGSFFPKHVARIVEEMSVLSGAEQDALGALCKKVGLHEEPQQKLNDNLPIPSLGYEKEVKENA